MWKSRCLSGPKSCTRSLRPSHCIIVSHDEEWPYGDHTYQRSVHVEFSPAHRHVEWICGPQRRERLVARDKAAEEVMDFHVHLPYFVIDFALPCVHVALARLFAIAGVEVLDVLFRHTGSSVGHWRTRTIAVRLVEAGGKSAAGRAQENVRTRGPRRFEPVWHVGVEY